MDIQLWNNIYYKFKKYLLIITITLVLSSCNQTNKESIKLDSNIMNEYADKTYQEFTEEINTSILSPFINANISNELFVEKKNSNSTVNSAQGSEITKFYTPESTLRYELEIFGETGKSVQNYYTDSAVSYIYLQILNSYYGSSSIFEGINSIMSYELNSYIIIDGSVVLIIDELNKKLLISENLNNFYSFEELDDIFDNSLSTD